MQGGAESGGTPAEYRAALRIKNDAGTHRKLGDAYRLAGESDKAKDEYDTVRRLEQQKSGIGAPRA